MSLPEQFHQGLVRLGLNPRPVKSLSNGADPRSTATGELYPWWKIPCPGGCGGTAKVRSPVDAADGGPLAMGIACSSRKSGRECRREDVEPVLLKALGWTTGEVDPVAGIRRQLQIDREVERLLVRQEAQRQVVELAHSDVAAPRERFKASLHRRSELRTLPKVEPLIEGLISRRAAVTMFGAYGVGKSFMNISMACSIATGHNWLGHEVNRVPVMYVIGEGASGLDDRISAWEKAWRCEVSDEDLIISVKPDSLADSMTWIALTEECRDLGIGFVIIDTFSSTAPDADETKDAPGIMRSLSDLATAIDGTALLTHHPGWSDATRTRGGYQLEGNADEVLVLDHLDKSCGLFTVTRKKVKEGQSGAVMHLRRRDLHGSCVIETAHPTEVAGAVAERILALVISAGTEGITAKQIRDALGIKTASTTTRPLRELVDARRIRAMGARHLTRYFVGQDG